MGATVTSIRRVRQAAVSAALALVFAMATGLMATAQEAPRDEGFFAATGRWFDEQFSKLGSGFKDAGKKVGTFGHEAGIAAKTTADGAKDAADAVAKLPNTRPITGHQTCRPAANGAPDCVAAANALCKSKGFGSGKSLDMTTAEVCPPKVYLSGRNSGPECTTETFVSRALCQ